MVSAPLLATAHFSGIDVVLIIVVVLLLAASAAYLRGRGLLVAPRTLEAIAAYALREPAGSTVKEPHLCPI